MPASPETELGRRLARLIAASGPIPVAQFMAEANAHYYATRDPLGANGDFTTAPEISQMFGELIGVWLADLWMRAGKPVVRFAELGPGRGTLAADALRAMRKLGLTPAPHFVETSPVLRARQAQKVAHAIWHDDVATLPTDAPLLVVANEFFDALPIRQLIKTFSGWRERMVGHDGSNFVPIPGGPNFDAAVPERLLAAEPGSILEACPAAVAIIGEVGRRLIEQGGALLAIDYGYADYAAGDTLQAVNAHAYADPFARAGESDLTAHVDFGILGEAGRELGLAVHGPAGQGDWLEALGITARAEMLARFAPARAEEVEAARLRLTAPDAMGTLFKVIALTAPGWPAPEGFAE